MTTLRPYRNWRGALVWLAVALVICALSWAGKTWGWL